MIIYVLSYTAKIRYRTYQEVVGCYSELEAAVRAAEQDDLKQHDYVTHSQQIYDPPMRWQLWQNDEVPDDVLWEADADDADDASHERDPGPLANQRSYVITPFWLGGGRVLMHQLK